MQVNLTHNNLRGSGAAIGEALKTSTSIKKLEMLNCSLGPEDASGLAGGISASASLTMLDARRNSSLGSEGEAALKDAVRSKKGFKLLI